MRTIILNCDLCGKVIENDEQAFYAKPVNTFEMPATVYVATDYVRKKDMEPVSEICEKCNETIETAYTCAIDSIIQNK